MDNIAILGFSDPLSSWTHFLAALGFAIGAFFMIRKGRGSTARVVSLVIYSFSLVFLFSMSGTFHLLERGGDARAVLQRLDHAGIWILIAGTFTPMHIILFRGPWRWLILAIVWVIAITGLVLEVVFFNSIPEAVVLAMFLGLGWMGALTGYKFLTSFRGESMKYLAFGGLFYSIGAAFDFLRWPIFIDKFLGSHEIFHLFVVAAALSHWLFIYAWCNHPIANKINFLVRVFPDGHLRAEANDENLVVTAGNSSELKASILEAVGLRYHKSIKPKIHLQYSHEEILTG
jgi:channel protein (hemolysin III family)